jgi:hypothetical protein
MLNFSSQEAPEPSFRGVDKQDVETETLRFGLPCHEVHKPAMATSHCDLVETITPHVAARPALHFWTLDPSLVVPLLTYGP